jgi:O-antigen ligase
MIPLMMMTKVIQKPFVINFSPADILLLFVGMILIKTYISDQEYRKFLLQEKALYFFLSLILLRAVSSIFSYNIGVVTLDYKSATLANIKFILSFLYFIVGISTVKFIGEKKTFEVFYISSLLFVVVGFLCQYIFKLLWWDSNSRLIALANDPNVAGLVIILGIIAGLKVMENNKLIYKVLIWISFLIFGFSLILTGSRTAILALFLIVMILLMYYANRPKRLLIIVSIGCLVVSSTLFIDENYFEAKGYTYLVSRVVHGTDSDSDFRSTLTQIANEMGKDHVLTGVGTGNYLINAPFYYEKMNLEMKKEQIAHNTFFSFYGENGIFATVLYIGLIIYLGCKIKDSCGWMYLIVLVTYSMFFNVENIRILWFCYGLYLFSTPSIYKNTDSFNGKNIYYISCLALLISYVLMPTLLLPYTASGQTFKVSLEENMYLFIETQKPQKYPLKISFSGIANKTEVIRNRLGFYYEPIGLPAGEYEITIESLEESIEIERFDLIGKSEYTVIDKLLSISALDVVEKYSSRKLDLIMSHNKYDSHAMYSDKLVLYRNEVKGVNFDNQVVLVSSDYIKNNDGTITCTLVFKKIMEIPYNYMLLMRGYLVNQEDFENEKELAKNYIFDKPLSELNVGDTFTAEWTFNTGDDMFMIYYGFYYKDNDSGVSIRPRPLYFREGFIQ